jgi:hypothetical protein
MLTGRVPFEGDSFVAVALRHVNEPAPDIRKARPDVPRRLAAALDKALQKDPARRFPTTRAFAEALRGSLATDSASEGVTEVIRRPAAPRTRRRRTTRPLRYVVVALLVALTALAAGIIFGGRALHSSPSAPVRLRGVASYDPVGQEEQIFGWSAPRATDGDPATAWQTQTYATPEFGGLKNGIGLVLSSPGSVALKSLTVATTTPGFTAVIKAGNAPSGPFATDSAPLTVGGKTTFTLEGKTGRYWLVWLTRLGPQGTAAITGVTAKK